MCLEIFMENDEVFSPTNEPIPSLGKYEEHSEKTPLPREYDIGPGCR